MEIRPGARAFAFSLATAIALLLPLAAPGSPVARPAPPPTRTAINTCDQAWLFAWGPDSSLPVRAHFPPSHAGEQFELLGAVRFTLEGRGYYETTIPTISGWGAGTHYWISDACVNPPPFKTPSVSSTSRP
jgi:hypothetical protein